MNKIFPTILCFFIAILGIITINNIRYRVKQHNLIKAYEQYYQGTESLLNDLDSAYNWVDGYDNYEYYSSKAKIDSLTHNIQ